MFLNVILALLWYFAGNGTTQGPGNCFDLLTISKMHQTSQNKSETKGGSNFHLGKMVDQQNMVETIQNLTGT